MDPSSSRQNAHARQKKKQKKPVIRSVKLKRLAEKQKVEEVEKLAMEYVSRVYFIFHRWIDENSCRSHQRTSNYLLVFQYRRIPNEVSV